MIKYVLELDIKNQIIFSPFIASHFNVIKNDIFIYNIFVFTLYTTYIYIYILYISDIVFANPLSQIKIKYDLLLTDMTCSSEVVAHLCLSVTYKYIEIIATFKMIKIPLSLL